MCPNKAGKLKSVINKIIYNNVEYTNEYDIAEKCNDHFVSVGQRVQESITPNNIDPLIYMRGSFLSSFYYSPIDEFQVQSIIISLKNKSCGVFCVPIKVVKAMADILSPVLARLINRSFMMGHFPQCLKVARITPIYKGGAHSDLGNYRPISILPTFSKIYEKVVYAQLDKYIAKNNILNNSQYGFRNKMSTTHAITNHLTYLYDKLEHDNFVMSIFVDFKKAFDCVDHDILLSKLRYYGIRGLPYNWFQSYLQDRRQYTVVGDSRSTLKNVTCGVPQGSNLGPLLFLIFINDLPNCSDMFQFTLFADDSTLTATFHRDETEITNKVNDELIYVNYWLMANKIAINADKTKYIAFTYRRQTMLNLIRIGDIRIRETTDIKFLGVYLDRSLTFKNHVKYISSKLAKSIGILNKLKYYLPLIVMKTLYRTFIQPYLLYGLQSWYSTYSNNTKSVVMLQKRAIRTITNSDYLAHTGPLFKALSILQIDHLFKYQILTYMYKTINWHYDLKVLAALNLQTDIHHYNTRNANSYRLPNYRKSMSRFSLIYLGPSLWNQLPLQIRDIPSFRKFKSRLIARYIAEY